MSLSPSLLSPSPSLLLRGPPFSQFSADGASEDSTFGTQTLLAMRKFLDEAELRSHQGMLCSSVASQVTKEVTNERSAECKGEDSAEDERRQTEAMKEVIRAFRTLLHGCEEQWRYAAHQDSESSGSEAEEALCQESPHAMMAQLALEEDLEDGTPDREPQSPQRYLCDDWIQPVKVARKPRVMTAKETMKANVAKNCLILTMMSLELGFGSVIERYQSARDAARNNGGTYDAWAYLRGCLTHLNSAPKCIGTLLLEDPLNARGNSLIPTVATLLTELSPEKQARDWLPPMTILYMAPGGHRQWPVSIKPMLDRLSWIVLRTRSLALIRLREALRARSNWKPYYRQGPRIDPVPAVPYKFLDIGTQMGEYQLEELTLKKDDKDNILHPRYTRSGIPPVDTFHSVVQGRVGSQYDIIQQWCTVKAWFESSPTCDFWVVEESKYRWGLPVLVPTCPRKLFMQGPRLKYIDIVTDTLHASSSDLITWNTLVLMKLKWLNGIPRQWIDITVNSLEAWETRDQLSQFHADTRRGYARVTPVALSHIGVPGSRTLPVDDFPKEGLGVYVMLYDDYEICDKFSGYIWATWTTMAAQPMQIDSALQALLNPSGRPPSGQPGVHYDLGVPVNVDAADQPMGSNECASGVAAPFPDSVEDVSMDSGADKRSRESPDSTLKPEGKSLKTSETATAPATKDTDEMSTADSVKPSNVTKRPKTVSEAKSLMREVHQRMPAWKAEKLLETCKVDQVDLAALGEATGILFASQDMLNEAVLHLDRIRKEKAGKEDADLDAPETSDPHSSQSKDQDASESKRSDDQKEKNTNAAPTGAASAVLSATGGSGGANNQDSKSSSKTPGVTSGQQDATASSSGSVHKEKQESAPETHKDWFSRVTKEGQEVLWPPVDSDKCPTLLTGVQPSDLKSLETLGWEDKLQHPKQVQSMMRSRNLLRNHIRTGLVVLQTKDMKCCGLYKAPAIVRRSSQECNHQILKA